MKSKGFTLIELLVVISIIGVIASIVLVSFSGQRDKARLARAQQFSSQINHALGAYAVGIWDFEDQSNPTADRSGFGNHGILYGNTHFVANDVLGGHALSFDGNGDYVEIPDSTSLSITGTGITLEAWIKPKVGASNGAIIHKNNHYSLRWQNTGTITYADSITWSYATIGYYGNAPAGQWNHIIVTFDGSTIRFYINGVEVGSKVRSGSLTDNAIDLGIGSYNFTSNFFNGQIDDVRIYSHALSAAQIQQHYALGVAKHGIALK